MTDTSLRKVFNAFPQAAVDGNNLLFYEILPETKLDMRYYQDTAYESAAVLCTVARFLSTAKMPYLPQETRIKIKQSMRDSLNQFLGSNLTGKELVRLWNTFGYDGEAYAEFVASGCDMSLI